MTDFDYKDLVDPFVRAEQEAFRRGYGQGILTGVFYAILCGLIGGALLLVSTRGLAAEAPPWERMESPRVIKASERGATVSVCQQNAVERGWSCFFIKGTK